MTKKPKRIVGYHFTGDALRNGEPIPPIRKWLEHTGPVVPCESGLHASEHVADALLYSPGPMLHRVELEGDLQPHGNPVDKWAGRRRRITASIDASELLRRYARWCALQVVPLWDAPAAMVTYLKTGDPSLRAAAEYAARAAARDAAAAAEYATRAAAEYATRAAEYATRAAARDAARAAARAAEYATRAAARDAQRRHLAQVVTRAFKRQAAIA